jgi:hypothetical protein
MAKRSIITSDLAVSESLGYIMIFGVIMACIALIYINGSQIIGDAQESTSFQGMEQSFDVIHSDLSKAAYEESPMMTTRVNLQYGTLYMRDPSESGCRLVVDAHSGTEYNQSLGIIRFDSVRWGKSISIENGAIVKMYGGSGQYGSIMTTEPRMYYSSNTSALMISVINIWNIPSIISVGNGIVGIESRYDNTTVQKIPVPDGNPVTIKFWTNYTGAWRDYFSGSDFRLFGLDPYDATDPDKVSITCNNDQPEKIRTITIVTYDIKIRIK